MWIYRISSFVSAAQPTTVCFPLSPGTMTSPLRSTVAPCPTIPLGTDLSILRPNHCPHGSVPRSTPHPPPPPPPPPTPTPTPPQQMYICIFKTTSSVTSMLARLCWKNLLDRRRELRLALLYKIVTGHVVVSADDIYLEKVDKRTPFWLYINDLPQVSEYFMPILFADDTNLFATGYNLNYIVSEINKEIANIYAWVKANKLSLNIDKTNFMLFTPKCVPRSINGIFIDGNKIMEVTETKFLGVIIDCKLNWSPHITYISKKVVKGVGIILKARKLLDQETLLTLYYTCVYPYLNYCIHVWGKAYNVHIHDLIILQNKAIRIVHGMSPRKNANKLYFDYNILSLKRLYSYNIGIFMYKFSKNMLPELFENFFCNVASVHEHSTRSACLNHIYVKFKGTTRGQKAFSYSGARIWNLILSHIETDCAIGTFKKLFAKLLLNSKVDLLSIWIWINVAIPTH